MANLCQGSQNGKSQNVEIPTGDSRHSDDRAILSTRPSRYMAAPLGQQRTDTVVARQLGLGGKDLLSAGSRGLAESTGG